LVHQAAIIGVDEQKLDAVWTYQTSPLFSAAERAALDVAVAAGCVPNAVTDDMFNELHTHQGPDRGDRRGDCVCLVF
jgi:alkylhydroperoxidase family enzyme